jgi:hypothetical protein
MRGAARRRSSTAVGWYRATPSTDDPPTRGPLGSIPGRKNSPATTSPGSPFTSARVASEAGAGQTFVSRTVVDLVAGSGLTFEDPGEHVLKGVPDRWRLYRVLSESA